MPKDPYLDQLLATMPAMRKWAVRLTGDQDRAEDLVQDTLLRAIEKRHLFNVGTNLAAWMTMIMRNIHISAIRRSWRVSASADQLFEETGFELTAPDDQEMHVHMEDMRHALGAIPFEMAQAILLIAEGDSYEEASLKACVPIGTIKSRIARGRAKLSALTEPAPELMAA
jgi:RNA polymerase sigma-70 factor (ECF subfamily)